MKFQLNAKLREKWLANQKTFLVPLALLYLGFVIVRISDNGVNLTTFVPTQAETTAITLFVLNSIYDYFRKLLK